MKNFTRSIIAGVAAGAVSVSAFVVPHATAQETTTTDMNLPLACYVQPKGSASGLRQQVNAGSPGFESLSVSMSATAPETVEVGQEFEYVIDPGTFSFPKQLSMLGATFDATFVSQANLWIDLPKNVEVVGIDYDKNTPLGFNVIRDGDRIRFVGEERRTDTKQTGPIGHNGQPVGDNPAEWVPNSGFFNRTNETRWFYGGAEIKKTVEGGSKLGTPLPKVTLRLKATGEPGGKIQASMAKVDAKNNNPQAPIQGLVRGVVSGQVINALTRCGLSEDYTGSGSKLPATPFPAVTIVEKKEQEPPVPVDPTSEEEATTSETSAPESPSTEPTTSETEATTSATTTSETTSSSTTLSSESKTSETSPASESPSEETSPASETTSSSAPEVVAPVSPESTTPKSESESSAAPTTSSSSTELTSETTSSMTTTSKQDEPKPSDNEQPKPSGNEQPKPSDNEQPKPSDNEQPKPSGNEQPKPSGNEEPKPADPVTSPSKEISSSVTSSSATTTSKQDEPKPTDKEEPKPTDKEEPKPTDKEEPKPANPETSTAKETTSSTPASESSAASSTTTSSEASSSEPQSSEPSSATTTSSSVANDPANDPAKGSGEGSSEGSAKSSSEGSSGSSNSAFFGVFIALGVFAGLLGLVGLANWLHDQGCEFIPEIKVPEITLPKF